MSEKDSNNLKPTTPWYQNFSIVLSWIWAGINLLPIFLSGLSNLDILSKWITWPVTIVGSILVGIILFGSPIYLKYFNVKWRKSETGRNRRIKVFDSRTMFTGLGILIALWIPRVSELYVPPKTTDIRIAVADFVVLDNSIPYSTARSIAQDVYETLDSNIKQVGKTYGNLTIEILPPDRTPKIHGNNPSEIETSAELVAHKSDADIILYGVITKGTTANSANVEPYFFLAENSVFGFPEFVGQDSWGSQIEYPFDNSIQANFQRQALSDTFSQRTTSLTYSIYGAWKYSIGDYKSSYDLFQKAAENTTLEDNQGKSVWYLWWGNAAIKLNQYDNANSYYQAALSFRPGYARAYIGLGETMISEVNYLLAQHGVSNAQEFLDAANTMVSDAMNATDRPKSADIDAKADFILGRIAQTKYYLTAPNSSPLLDEAATYYTKVTSDYERGNHRIAEQAGLSYMHLGEIAITRQRYDVASKDFDSALAVLRDPLAIELTRSTVAELPVISPLQAQAQLETAVAISSNESHKKEYEARINCLSSPSTPVPTPALVCPP